MKAYIEAQGSLLQLKVMGGSKRQNRASMKRGRIRHFSSQSRRRLLRFMARLKMEGVRATFITLTFRGCPTNAQAKMVLKRFLMRLGRFAPKASCIWRMEFQKRGAIHFHLLCFRLPFWKQTELQLAWSDCVGQANQRVDIRLVKSRRGVMHYVSKYIAKVTRCVKLTSLVSVPYQHAYRKWRKGRYWGYQNKARLPLGQKFTGVLVRSDLIKRLSKSAWEIIGYDTRYNSISFSLFTDSAVALFRRYIDAGGLDADEWHWSQQIPDKQYPDSGWKHVDFSPAALKNDYVKSQVPLSRPSVASSYQPCTKDWISPASFVHGAAGDFP